MKLIVTVDNNSRTDRYFLSESALCFYIEEGNKKIFFDLGYSDIVLKNALKLGIDIKNIDNIVFSHSHNDHTGGLFYLNNLYREFIEHKIPFKIPEIISHKEIFEPLYEDNIGCISSPVFKNQLIANFKTNLSDAPIKLTENLYYSGRISNGNIDETALFYTSKYGVVIITGCSHSGLKNIIEKAEKTTGQSNIYAITGGFHLLDKSEEEIKGISSYLKEKGIKELYPSHCTSLKSKVILSQEFDVVEVCTGDEFNF